VKVLTVLFSIVTVAVAIYGIYVAWGKSPTAIRASIKKHGLSILVIALSLFLLLVTAVQVAPPQLF